MGRASAVLSCKHASVLVLLKLSLSLYFVNSSFANLITLLTCVSSLRGQSLVIGSNTSSAKANTEATLSPFSMRGEPKSVTSVCSRMNLWSCRSKTSKNAQNMNPDRQSPCRIPQEILRAGTAVSSSSSMPPLIFIHGDVTHRCTSCMSLGGSTPVSM
eukprot:6490795-Amphidinium_carterae.2